MAIRIVALSVAGGLLLATTSGAASLEAAAAGAALGGALAWLGLANTRFEGSGEARSYTPNGWIGLAVTALFLGRLVTRAFAAAPGATAVAFPTPFAGARGSPLTAALFFLMAAYHVAYDLGVLRRSRAPRATET